MKIFNSVFFAMFVSLFLVGCPEDQTGEASVNVEDASNTATEDVASAQDASVQDASAEGTSADATPAVNTDASTANDATVLDSEVVQDASED